MLSSTLFFILSSVVWSAVIISPKEDEQVEAGSTISIIVKPDTGEQWKVFVIGFKELTYDFLNKVYKTTIQVPNDSLGYRNDLRVIGVDSTGRDVELSRRVFVKLPPNVVLKGIIAGYSGNDFISLKKMPENSNVVDIERYGTRQLTTHGQYSDNVNREMTSAASGTTYTSSNEKVVTVDAEGNVKAQGIGTATITVRNGKYSATVTVVVKQYK